MRFNLSRYIRLIKQAVTDYRWFLFYLQRMDYNPKHRIFISYLLSLFLPKTPNNQITSEIQKLIQTLKEDGLVVLENFVDKTKIAEMRTYLATKLCFDPQRPELGGFSSPEMAHKSSVHAYYTPDDIVSVPHLLELANCPKLLTIIEDIFGAKPTIANLQIWWLLYGFDQAENSHEIYVNKPGEFHRDVDDWSEIKLFIYLTNVDEESGPHAFIKNSHTWLLPPRQRSIDINHPNYPLTDNLIKVTGEAGLAWLSNSYGLHRGMIPTHKHRLILSVTYSLFPLPYSPKNPCKSSPDDNKFDACINRVFLTCR